MQPMQPHANVAPVSSTGVKLVGDDYLRILGLKS